jgi:hypothetical protein
MMFMNLPTFTPFSDLWAHWFLQKIRGFGGRREGPKTQPGRFPYFWKWLFHWALFFVMIVPHWGIFGAAMGPVSKEVTTDEVKGIWNFRAIALKVILEISRSSLKAVVNQTLRRLSSYLFCLCLFCPSRAHNTKYTLRLFKNLQQVSE